MNLAHHDGPLVTVRDLRRVYQVGGADVHALRGVDLQLGVGELVGIVGVSGSGKSTLLHLMGGLDSPTSGQIHVAGQALSDMNSNQRALFRRTLVGFVFQSFYLVPNLTALENLRLTLTLQGKLGVERQQLAKEAVERVGLAERASHKPGQLSAGEQQRITIARAIVHRPRLLLADEPTGNLDQATAVRLMTLIDDIRRESSMTVVIVTHDEPLISRFSDRIVRMQDGRFIET